MIRRCPYCKYEFDPDNSDYVPLSGEDEEIVDKFLFKYHLNASRECRKAFMADVHKSDVLQEFYFDYMH